MAFLTFIISMISVCVGYVSALLINYWLLKSARAKVAAAREDAEISVSLERRELHEFFAHVQSVAVTVDGSMDRHISRVAAFNDEVVQNVAKDPKAILRAAKQLLEANVQLQEELHSAREQVSVKQRQIESYISDARTDALTGIANRRAFDYEIRRLFAQRQRQGNSFSLLLVDIDHFKWFNDYHGHQVGDEMLRLVAGTFSHTLRDMDLVCRYGGEEFVMILPGTSLLNAIRAARRVHEALEQTSYRAGDALLRVTVSIGVAEVHGDENVEKFIKRLDEALYAAKHAGRNCTWYHDGMKCLPESVSPKVTAVVGTPTAVPRLDGSNASDPVGENDSDGINREQESHHADVVAIG